VHDDDGGREWGRTLSTIKLDGGGDRENDEESQGG
jgi:hypothetical protein